MVLRLGGLTCVFHISLKFPFLILFRFLSMHMAETSGHIVPAPHPSQSCHSGARELLSGLFWERMCTTVEARRKLWSLMKTHRSRRRPGRGWEPTGPGWRCRGLSPAARQTTHWWRWLLQRGRENKGYYEAGRRANSHPCHKVPK